MRLNKKNIVKALIILSVISSVSFVILISFKSQENHTQINSDTEQIEQQIEQIEQTKTESNLLPTAETNEKEIPESNKYADTDTYSKELFAAGKQNFRIAKNQTASAAVVVKKVSDWVLNEKGNIQVEVTLENPQKEKVFIRKVTLSIINHVEEKNLAVLEKEAGITIKPGDSTQIVLDKRIDNLDIFPENDGHLLYEVFLE